MVAHPGWRSQSCGNRSADPNGYARGDAGIALWRDSTGRLDAAENPGARSGRRLAPLALLAGFYFSPAGGLLRARTTWSMADWAGGARPFLWRDSIRMAAARWLVGFGPETFSIWFPRYQSAELARAYPSFYQESPHNIFLDALTDQGVVGAGLFIAVTVLGFYAAWKARGSAQVKVLAAALVALVVSQQFTVFTAVTAVFFYVTIALLVSTAFAPEVLPASRHHAGRLIAGGLAAAVFLPFAISLVYVDAWLARVNYLAYYGRIREAVASYQQVERWHLPGVRTDLWYSRAIARAAHKSPDPADVKLAMEQGLESAIRATRNAEERENAWLNLAVFYGRAERLRAHRTKPSRGHRERSQQL